jgi:predicted nucleic acid-binding protein
MSVFADTSFLCAVHREQDNSYLADAWIAQWRQPVFVSTLVLFEFRQSVHFQTWLHSQNRSKGFSVREGKGMLANLEHNLAVGSFEIAPVDWTAVHALAEQVAVRHTAANGYRGFDILHVSTARHLMVAEFLSFDRNQRKLANAEGLREAP